MTIKNLLKLAALTIVSFSLITGCSSDAAEEPAPEVEAPEQTGPSAEAKNAIYTAKIKMAKAQKLGYEWRDTASLIKDAEKAAAAGDNDKAIELANQAAAQADDAIAQHESEMKRYQENIGSTESPEENSMMASEYTVESGDSLWGISAKDDVYANPYQWPLIYKANSDQIKDADLIFPGQVFSIPAASEAEIEAAVMHAKTRGAWTVGEVEASDQDYLAQ